jgi:hypothetical protein
MAFPTAPKKPVKGKLKLIIRAPVTSEDVPEEEEKEDLGEDFSDQLDVKAPRGFSITKE